MEIDKIHFPDADKHIYNLSSNKVFYTSNEYDDKNKKNNCFCYRFEFDENSISNVSAALADIIKDDYLYNYADSIIKNNYIGVDNCCRNEIISSAINSLNTEKIIDLISSFIIKNRHIHLGGFVLFRMRDYLQYFEDEIDFAVDEFIEQQRYRDFVKLLKFFVDIQDSDFEIINLVFKDSEHYALLDKNGVPLNKDLLDSTHCEISALENCDSYLMINDLISLAPRHITIHCDAKYDDYEPIKIIKEIFTNRVNICHQCNICFCTT